jgi:hypothetical protein
MGILGKIFGSDKVIDAGISAIDAMVYTDEEKANMELSKSKMKIEILKAYEPFKLAQRVLAFGITGLVIVLVLVSLGVMYNGGNVSDVYAVADHFNIGLAFISIIVFYFGSGATEGIIKQMKSKK